MIGRRHHLAAMLATIAAPRLAAAQARPKRRLAFVHSVVLVSPVMSERSPWSRAFFAELGRLGYSEDTNLIVEGWSARSDPARYEALARDVLASRPDAALVFGTAMSLAFRKAGGTVPVVFLASGAVELGLVDSLARPGGNMTGIVAEDFASLYGKVLEFLHEIVPTAKTVALLTSRREWDSQEATFREPARRRGLTPVGMLMEDPIGPAEYRRVFSEVGTRGVDLLVVAGQQLYRGLIAELAAQYQLPAGYILHHFTYSGEMMVYGDDASDHPRLVASHVARVLNGEKPAEIPVLNPDKYKLTINFKTVRALGLTIPPSLLARVGEVIE